MKVYGIYGTPQKCLQITRVLGGEEDKGAESLFREIMAENFPNWGRDMNIQVYEEI